MANLTGPFDVPQKPGNETRIQAAAVKNYRGGAAAIIAGTGYATPLVVSTASMQFIGVYLEGNDNSNGVAGTISHGAPGSGLSSFVRIARTGVFIFNQSGITQASVGTKAYFSDDNTITTTAGAIFAGIIVTVNEGASQAEVDIQPAVQTIPASIAGNSFILKTATLVTNVSGAAQTFVTQTVPANSLRVGDRIKIKGELIGTTRTSTDTCSLLLKMGSTTIATLPSAFAHATTNFLTVELELLIRTIGASGTMVGTGWYGAGTAGATFQALDLASTTIDTTVAEAFTINGTFSASNTTDQITVNIFDLDIVRA